MALPRFEGKPVIASRMAIVGAGDGLSAALDLEPVALKIGQRVRVVLEGEVRDVDHTPIKKGENSVLARKHVVSTEGIMLVTDESDDAQIKLMLAADADRLQRAKDSAEGQGRLDDELPDDELDDDERAIRDKVKGTVKKA